MSKENVIRCRFCSWQTTKWGKRSNPSNAFRRLFRHIEEEHLDDKEAGELIDSLADADVTPLEPE